MLNLTEHAKFLTEFYVRTQLDRDFFFESRSLQEARFLSEQVDLEDVTASVDKAKVDIMNVSKFYAGLGPEAADLATEIAQLAKNIPNPSGLLSAAYGDDEENTKKLAKTFVTKMNSSLIGVSSVISAMAELAKNITPLIDRLPDDAVELTIGELAEKAKSDPTYKGVFIPSDKLAAGMKKAFIPSKTFKDAFKKGSEMAATSSGDAKSKLGKFFSTATKFLGGFFEKPPGEAYPKLLKAFSTYVTASTPADFLAAANKIKMDKGRAMVASVADATEESSNVAAVAAGAKPAEENAAGGASKKAKSGELETELGGDEKAKAFVAALKGHDLTKQMLEARIHQPGKNLPSLSYVIFEAPSYSDLLKIAQGTPGVEKKDAEGLAAKAVKFLKLKGLDVDDAGAPAVSPSADAPADDDAATATAAAAKAVADAKASAATATMGKAIHKAMIDYIQPFVDRKSLSAKARKTLEAAVEDGLKVSIDTAAKESAQGTIKLLRGALESWFNGLEPEMQKKLGGPTGSKKVVQVAAKTIEDIVTKNFKIEENRRRMKAGDSDNQLAERWLRLAGIK
jgi:hypothetical protein